MNVKLFFLLTALSGGVHSQTTLNQPSKPSQTPPISPETPPPTPETPPTSLESSPEKSGGSPALVAADPALVSAIVRGVIDEVGALTQKAEEPVAVTPEIVQNIVHSVLLKLAVTLIQQPPGAFAGATAYSSSTEDNNDNVDEPGVPSLGEEEDSATTVKGDLAENVSGGGKADSVRVDEPGVPSLGEEEDSATTAKGDLAENVSGGGNAVPKTSAPPVPTMNPPPGEDKQLSDEEICHLPAQTGLCRGYLPRFHFDVTKGACTSFIYGGCGGNQNRFHTLEECMSFCAERFRLI